MPEKVTPVSCSHQNFNSQCNVSAIEHNKKIVGYQASLRIQCAQCGVDFHFPNVPKDESCGPNEAPTVSDMCRQLTAPIMKGGYAPEMN